MKSTDKKVLSITTSVADITAACAGYAAGLLVKDAFNIGKKY